MRATLQLKYAIYGIFDLAYNGEGKPVSLNEMGARQQIPVRYLEQIFQKLRRASLVQSKRGPGGGYVLARAPEDISLADVVLAVQGAIVSLGEGDGTSAAECPEFVWEMIREGLEKTLSARSMADLCRVARERGVVRAQVDPVMYEI
ncbi:MAG: Rrf2 family transcriptional regulator [bacterium]|nr:Rrf2 family transcriptional regulator [bacterium]